MIIKYLFLQTPNITFYTNTYVFCMTRSLYESRRSHRSILESVLLEAMRHNVTMVWLSGMPTSVELIIVSCVDGGQLSIWFFHRGSAIQGTYFKPNDVFENEYFFAKYRFTKMPGSIILTTSSRFVFLRWFINTRNAEQYVRLYSNTMLDSIGHEGILSTSWNTGWVWWCCAICTVMPVESSTA